MNGITLPVKPEDKAARKGPVRGVILDDLSLVEGISNFLNCQAIRACLFIGMVGYPNSTSRNGISKFLDVQ